MWLHLSHIIEKNIQLHHFPVVQQSQVFVAFASDIQWADNTEHCQWEVPTSGVCHHWSTIPYVFIYIWSANILVHYHPLFKSWSEMYLSLMNYISILWKQVFLPLSVSLCLGQMTLPVSKMGGRKEPSLRISPEPIPSLLIKVSVVPGSVLGAILCILWALKLSHDAGIIIIINYYPSYFTDGLKWVMWLADVHTDRNGRVVK